MAFNGPWPQWRTALDWDSGPQVQPGEWTIDCRINISWGSDDYCGNNPAHFSSTDLGYQRTWWPSSRSYTYNEGPLRDGRRYHDDEKGEFCVYGWDGVFRIGGPAHRPLA
ncbi:hypothetical protein ABZW18_06370 [Streptomyces sp. NPDC004647]|uniref:hypothetical protein n=1 Tax=Streptomyces sp. NPDC004647 TaxID=3154671 RepID=UPI0033B48A46